MENASKALIMAAGVLIGILIISLGISLYNILGEYVSNSHEEIENTEIAKFNDNFLKYVNKQDLTIQDVITARNFALNSNKSYTGYDIDTTIADENSYYVDVYLDGFGYNKENILKNVSEVTLFEKYVSEINDDGQKPKITCTVKISSTTGRVYEVLFEED